MNFPKKTVLLLTCALALQAGAAPLPPPAGRLVDFTAEIKPLFESSCIKCHAKGKAKGGFNMETRENFLKGGDDGAAAVPGNSAESSVVDLVAGTDPDEVMPKKGSRWTPEQIGLLRAWIDQGMPWDGAISFAKPDPQNLHPRAVALPDSEGHPIDRLLAPYFAAHSATPPPVVEDRVFARRLYLDSIGLLPTPAQMEAFLADPAPDKRERLVDSLLGQARPYAEHWLTFWNDLLRNDYQGTGFIDGGRRQISRWLYLALLNNTPYDRFVAELVNPTPLSEGFVGGIIWRGTVNASMTPPMQAAQNLSQVFMGVNLKCASCHDSFINDWALPDAYGLAAVYSDGPMELIHCDKPTGKKAAAAFLYPSIGAIDASADKAGRLARLASLMTDEKNGRLASTVVNRLWARLLGRGLVEPLDDMDQPAWNQDLIDWLAADLRAHQYDLKRTLALILTSRAYQFLVAAAPKPDAAGYVFAGPLARRLTAEQFSDALSGLADTWARLPSSLEFDFNDPQNAKSPVWVWTGEPLSLSAERSAARETRRRLDDALKKLTLAQQAVDAAEKTGGPAVEKAKAAMADASAALGSAQSAFANLQVPLAADAPPEAARHSVVFRKKFTLPKAPEEAYAAILVSQRFEIHVNGKVAKSTLRDGARNGRIALFDLRPLLVAGENVLAIDVSSHTEKQMNDSERKAYPASTAHLNKQSGLAFYLRVKSGDALQEIVTDASWKVRRNPEPGWNGAALSDAAWAAAAPLPEGVAPIDEGPSLEPVLRKDFASVPVQLGPQVVPAVSVASHAGKIRAALLAADPLQTAMERPNREQVITARTNAATTLQALELTNGATLNQRLTTTAALLVPEAIADPKAWIDQIYARLLNRAPRPAERAIALEMLGSPVGEHGVTDLLWALVNLPEFQLLP